MGGKKWSIFFLPFFLFSISPPKKKKKKSATAGEIIRSSTSSSSFFKRKPTIAFQKTTHRRGELDHSPERGPAAPSSGQLTRQGTDRERLKVLCQIFPSEGAWGSGSSCLYLQTDYHPLVGSQTPWKQPIIPNCNGWHVGPF